MAGVERSLRDRLGCAGAVSGTSFELPNTLRVLACALLGITAPHASFAQSMTLPGKFSVGTSGAATYNIPIAVPPGTAGVTPSLSIEYNSQGSNGLLGIGWSLGGLPSIGRCPQTLAQDGALGAVTFSSSDRFCMDGQRLVLLSGTYGADGAQYRTEVETFSEIVSHGTAGNGPAWFEVHTKSGQIMQFGNTTDSLVLAKGTSTARSWALNKLSDTKGNYFTVTYTNDTTNGQAYPVEIDYTGNAGASLSPNNKVQFVYATRPDISPQYQSGSLSQTTVRLTDVKTFAGTSVVADYKLAYQQSTATQSSLLSSVTLCGGDGSCLPATNVSWQSGGTGFSNGAVNSGNGFVSDTATNDPGLIPLDLNGDGKTDFVQLWNNSGHLTLITYLSKGDGTFTAGSFDCPSSGFDSTGSGLGPGIFMADLNGDGRTDLVQQWNNSGHVTLITYLSKGDGTFTIGSFDCPTCGFASTTVGTTQAGRNGKPPIGSTGMLTADLNGDGRTDIIQQWNNSGHVTLITYLSKGDGTFTVGSFDCPSCGFDSVGPGQGTGMVAADLNGDGRTDLVQQWDNAGTLWFVIYLSNGDGTFSVSSASSANGWTGGYLLAADLNGDGKSDLVQQWNNGGTLWFITYLSKGDGTFVPRAVSSGNGWTGGYLLPADLNGDGKADLVQQWDNSGALWLITYQSMGDGTFVSAGAASGNGWTGGNLFAVDLNGDGKSDLVQPWNNSGPLWFITYLGKSPFPDLMTTVAAGTGSATSITYLPITNSSVYTKDSTASYPQMDMQSPIYVVSQVSTSNGIGGTYSSNYSYAGAKLDLTGRGFLGFRQMTVTDPQTGITDITNYFQSFPYLGLVATTTRTIGSQTLGLSTNTFQFSNVSGTTTISPSSAPYQVSLSQNVSSGADLEGSAMPTVTTSNQYDAFGNATQVVVSASDGYSKTTNNTYTNDTTNWYLGRLTQSSVTSVAP